jgi:ribonuclease HI
MSTFRDIKTKEFFEIEAQNDEVFQDTYEFPYNLKMIDVWYCDGSGFNGTTSSLSCGNSEKNIEVITERVDRTNNEMEYLALIHCCSKAREFDVIKTDSQLVVNQIKGKYKCNAQHLRNLRDWAIQLIRLKNLEIIWIPRDKNIAGKGFEKRIF